LHVHVNEPVVFAHVALALQLLPPAVHSLMSVQFLPPAPEYPELHVQV